MSEQNPYLLIQGALPPRIYPLPDPVFQTLTFSALADKIGVKPAKWLLWCTAAVESGFRNYPLKNNAASGVWQIMPTTRSLLSKAYGLKPYDNDNLPLQSEYAASMLLEGVNFYHKFGAPPMVKEFLKDKKSSPMLESLLSIRAYYHGGPSIRFSDASLLGKKGLKGTVYDDIMSGINKFYQYYEQATK